jgi:hypothetical protein
MLFAAPGEIIGSGFTFGMVRGLDRDYSDGSIWMTTAVSNNCQIGKFDAETREQIGDWVTATGQYWCFDCGYGYIHNGTTSIILVDQNAPHMRMYNPTTGAYIGSLPNAFPEYSYDDGLGVYAGPGITNTYLWASSYNGNPIKKSNYPCTSWSSFATCPGTSVMGVAYDQEGYQHRLFVVTTSPDYKIYCFDADFGTLEDIWPLIDWTYYVMGMAMGRYSIGSYGNDSVFIATFYPSNMIYEVKVGDWVNVQPTSLGSIKAAFH